MVAHKHQNSILVTSTKVATLHEEENGRFVERRTDAHVK